MMGGIARRYPLGTSLIVAIPWAIWHAPLFWLDTWMRGFQPLMVPGFLVGLAAGSIVLTWLVEGSASILVVALCHTMLNIGTATDAAPDALAAVTSMLIIVWAALIVHRWRVGSMASATTSDLDIQV